jgi:hypothetical protein
MKTFKIVLATIAVTLAVVLVFQNTHPVTTRLLFYTVTVSNAVVIGSSLLLGLTAGILGTLAWSYKRTKAKQQSQEKPDETKVA